MIYNKYTNEELEKFSFSLELNITIVIYILYYDFYLILKICQNDDEIYKITFKLMHDCFKDFKIL